MFSCEYCEIFKTPVLKIICERLLSKVKLNLSKVCKSSRVWLKLIKVQHFQTQLKRCRFFEDLQNISSWLLLRLTISVLFINMSYWCSIDVVCFNVNLIALFKLNPRATKTSLMWNNDLIFFVCLYNRYSLALEVLYERSRLFEDSLNLEICCF